MHPTKTLFYFCSFPPQLRTLVRTSVILIDDDSPLESNFFFLRLQEFKQKDNVYRVTFKIEYQPRKRKKKQGFLSFLHTQAIIRRNLTFQSPAEKCMANKAVYTLFQSAPYFCYYYISNIGYAGKALGALKV